jgi:hypothetical protein
VRVVRWRQLEISPEVAAIKPSNIGFPHDFLRADPHAGLPDLDLWPCSMIPGLCPAEQVSAQDACQIVETTYVPCRRISVQSR